MLVVDVVESTRLLEHAEDDHIDRWRRLVDYVEEKIVPVHGGKFVKSTGDGFLLAFPDCKSALDAAFLIQQESSRANAKVCAERQILLRMGIEFCSVFIDKNDFYGRGVMRAVRLMTLAGPGEIVVSAGVRDRLVPSLDANIYDLGDCYLKHVQAPVRAYRVGPPGPHPKIDVGFSVGELLPTIAVIPFSDRSVGSDHGVVGEILADELINALSVSAELNVISRLSTTIFRDRGAGHYKIASYLNAHYILSGAYRISNGTLALEIELAESKSGQVVWTDRLSDPLAGLLSHDSEVVNRVIAAVRKAIIVREVRRARSRPLPNVESYTLLVSSINLMHRLSRESFNDAYRLLETLIERASRQATPYAWLANWYVLKVQQGWSDNREKDGKLALECTRRALEADPHSSLAHTIDGFVHTNLLRRLDTGLECYERALENNPNEALAWLLKGTLHAFMGQGLKAVDETQKALRLTPLDPHRYFYDSLAATACLSAHQYENAELLAIRSLNTNRVHTSTLRVLASSQWLQGKHDEARESAQRLMRLEPSLTVSGWLARSPSAAHEIGSEWAMVLRQVGIPE